MVTSKKVLYVVIGLMFGFLATNLTKIVLAAFSDPNGVINACVSRLGTIRIIQENQKCVMHETLLSWSIGGGSGTPGPAGPTGPTGAPGPQGVSGESLGGFLPDLRGVNLQYAALKYHKFTGYDFSGADMLNCQLNYSDVTNAKFIGTNLVDSDLTKVNFTNANLSGALFGGYSLGPGISDVIWSNTICPDGTNSNDHDNTCVGHLTF
jgi:hypothetical protein